MKTLFIFDKDGTLIEFPGLSRPASIPEEQVLLPGRKEKITELRAAGHKIALASNQGGVAWGFISYSQAEILMNDIVDKIGGADFVRFCPHDVRAAGKPASNSKYAVSCNCRKPAPGMLTSILAEAGIRPENAVYIGDRPEDENAAHNAGIDFIWADTFFQVV